MNGSRLEVSTSMSAAIVGWYTALDTASTMESWKNNGRGSKRNEVAVEEHITIPEAALWTGIAGAFVTVIGWFIKLAARTALDGFNTSITSHQRAIEKLSESVEAFRREVADLRVEMAEIKATVHSPEYRKQ